MGDVKYAKFRVGDLLGSAKRGKYHNPKDLYFDASGYRYICASNANNGVNKQMPSVNGSNLNIIGPRIIAWGKQCPMFTYHDVECVTSQGMYYYDVSALSERTSLYVIGALTACVANSHYGYSNCLIGKVADELIIELPVTSAGMPDWNYMAERIAELEAYLVVAGLDDCELTDEDKRALSLSRKSASDEDGCSAADAGLRWKEFKVGELFENISRGTRLTKANRVCGMTPLLTAGIGLGQGVAEFISETAGMSLHNHAMTIDMFGNVFWHDYACYGDDDIHFFETAGVDTLCGLYLTTAVQKAVGEYDYGKQFRMKLIDSLVVRLPVTSAGTPDWDYMRAYIRAQEKLVMVDVANMTQNNTQRKDTRHVG